MMSVLGLAFLLGLSCFHQTVGSEADDLQLTIPQGTLRGKYETTVKGRRFKSFTGIPYAKPIVGNNRFKESQPAEPWVGVYDATELPTECLQYNHYTHLVHGTEDCLYVNVHVPEAKVPQGKSGYEVIVYIHGGAFTYGAGTLYKPHFLLDKDVIVVTLNYRVGPLGFLSTEDDVVPGNNGLKDQSLALWWIKNNIGYFGGNPEKITITGTSAGGASVHYHILSPLSRGSFSQAASMSGCALLGWTQAEKMREKAFRLGDILGCPQTDSKSLIKCLRNRPAYRIVSEVKKFMPWLYNPYTPFGPVVEKPGPKAFISEAPIDIIKGGKAADVPWIASLTTEEGLYPAAEILRVPQQVVDLEKNWYSYAPHLLDYFYTAGNPQEIDVVSKKVNEFYFKNGAIDTKGLIKMCGERLFDIGLEKAARLHAKHYSSSVYSYLFSYRGEHSLSDLFIPKEKPDLGVSHGDDTAHMYWIDGMDLTAARDLEMKDDIVDMWVEFAKTGVPIFKGASSQWIPVDRKKTSLNRLHIKAPRTADMEVKTDFKSEKFWDSLGLKENLSGSPHAHHQEL